MCIRDSRYTLRRRDFLPDYRGSLDEAARAMYRSEVGTEAPGRIAVMANLSSLGWNFNPITLYFFYDGDTVDRAIAEVTNTPWGAVSYTHLLGSKSRPSIIENPRSPSPRRSIEISSTIAVTWLGSMLEGSTKLTV